MPEMAKSTTCSPIHTAEIGARNHDTSSMPTAHCALFKMAVAGISKRLKVSSLKIDKKKNQFARKVIL